MSKVRVGCRLAFNILMPVINVGSPLGSLWVLAILVAITWACDFSLYQSGWFIVE